MTTTQQTIARFDLPDILSAALVPGKKRPLHGKAGSVRSGDAILIDPALRLLAVADGPERNPAASSSFLALFHDAVVASGVLTLRDPPIEEQLRALILLTNDLIKTVDYHDSTTFSALVMTEHLKSAQAIVLHAGDSLIFRINGHGGDAAQVSRTSHVLVGRSPALFQTEIVALAQTDMVVLASDGLTDLARTHASGPGDLLGSGITDPAPRALIDRIVGAASAARVRIDDISIVCASVGRLVSAAPDTCGNRIILT